MTKEEWNMLKVGDYVQIKNSVPRQILKIKNDRITLLALKKTKYGDVNTIYAKNDRWRFNKIIKQKG